MFGAFDAAALAGFVAFVRPRRTKLAHGAEVAGMYVAPEFRRRGAGRLLLAALVAHARSLPGVRQIKLAATRANAAARALYESAGLVRFGVEPDALCVDGVFYDDEHYLLRLA